VRNWEEERRFQLLGNSGGSRHWRAGDNHRVAEAIATAALQGRPISIRQAAELCGVEPTQGYTPQAIISIMDILTRTNWNAGIRSGSLNSMGYYVPQPSGPDEPVRIRDWRDGQAFPRDLVPLWTSMSPRDRYAVVLDPEGPVAQEWRARLYRG
jgi:hypothetical protein